MDVPLLARVTTDTQLLGRKEFPTQRVATSGLRSVECNSELMAVGTGL